MWRGVDRHGGGFTGTPVSISAWSSTILTCHPDVKPFRDETLFSVQESHCEMENKARLVARSEEEEEVKQYPVVIVLKRQ